MDSIEPEILDRVSSKYETDNVWCNNWFNAKGYFVMGFCDGSDCSHWKYFIYK